MKNLKRRDKNNISARNNVRIIAGKYKNRRVQVIDSHDLRPTGARVRETIFNWLQLHIEGAQVLDVCAGSGALGLEALSRHARSAFFVDNDVRVKKNIEQIFSDWQIDNAQFALANAFKLAAPTQQYDIIFIDPPFANAHLHELLAKYASALWLAPMGKIYLESNCKHEAISIPDGYIWQRRSNAGKVYFGIIGREI